MNVAAAKKVIARSMMRDAALGKVSATDAVAAFADAGFEESKHSREHGKFASHPQGSHGAHAESMAAGHRRRAEHHEKMARSDKSPGARGEAKRRAHSQSAETHRELEKKFLSMAAGHTPFPRDWGQNS